MHCVRTSTLASLLTLVVISMTCLADPPSDYRAGSLVKEEPQSIYAADPRDSWNRIFYFLFTRTTEFRLTEDFKEGAPFFPTITIGNPALPVSSRTFGRIESGDRAIDPLYPNFITSKGVEALLADPQFTEFKHALKDAYAEPTPRSPLHRALMQSDVWAAYDILSRERQTNDRLGDRARDLLPLLDRFIGKLALKPAEIATLPRNYEMSEGLPEFFDASSGWTEVEWFPERLHDESADFRRAARVFLKPTKPQEFLADVNNRVRQRKDPLPDATTSLDGAAIVTEDLLIDSDGRVVPSPLTYEVQLRTFVKDRLGKFKETTVAQYELSRKLLLADPSSSGFIRLDAEQPAYLPSAGNDYTFASPTLGNKTGGAAILGNLRRRCQSCHGVDAASLFTFEIASDPGQTPRLARRLRVADDLHASYVAKEKMEQPNFKSLHGSR